jgi:hypothetical protein
VRKRGPTKRERVEAAYRVLDSLLRSPKTRAGLIAAVADTMSKNFVYGYLSQQIHTGAVTVLKASDPPLYQMTEYVVIEKPKASVFPGWLEPRALPTSTQRLVHIDGKLVQQHVIRGEQQL